MAKFLIVAKGIDDSILQQFTTDSCCLPCAMQKAAEILQVAFVGVKACGGERTIYGMEVQEL